MRSVVRGGNICIERKQSFCGQHCNVTANKHIIIIIIIITARAYLSAKPVMSNVGMGDTYYTDASFHGCPEYIISHNTTDLLLSVQEEKIRPRAIH